MSEPKYQHKREVLEAGVGGELVALDLGSGDCFGFNLVAADIWQSLAQARGFDELRDELLDQYEVGADQCSLELQELLDELVAKGLIEKIG